MNKLVTAAVTGGAALAVAILPAAGLASAATPPTPTPAPVSSPAPPPMPVHHRPVHRHKPKHGHGKGHSHRGHSHKTHKHKRKPTTQAAPGIIGGQTVTDAPWAAQVSWADTGFECSGTAVAAQWVLTAGHCVDPNGSGMTVLIGSPMLGEGQRAAVDKATVDPDGDLALLHLDQPVRTKYVPLADEDPEVGDLNEIYGWGRTSPTSGPAQQLKMAKVRVTSTDCEDGSGGPAICSKAVTGAAFEGDSGGPELADGTEVGVCSTGDIQARAQQYASVPANRDWIREVANV